ncbi:MAG TPA: hypothetical protein VGK71_07015, partial [Nitrospirota bacterium]
MKSIIEKTGLFGSIKGKLILYFLLLFLVPMIFLSLLAYQSERSALRDRIKGNLASMADIQKGRIQAWLSERRSDAGFIAGNRDIAKNLVELKSLESS